MFTLQKHRVSTDFYIEYNEAMEAYFDGEWEYAIEALDKCLNIDPDDGPAQELKRFIKEENNSTVPERWSGFRNVSLEMILDDFGGYAEKARGRVRGERSISRRRRRRRSV